MKSRSVEHSVYQLIKIQKNNNQIKVVNILYYLKNTFYKLVLYKDNITHDFECLKYVFVKNGQPEDAKKIKRFSKIFWENPPKKQSKNTGYEKMNQKPSTCSSIGNKKKKK